MAMSRDQANQLIREAFMDVCDQEYRSHERAEKILVSIPFDLYMIELIEWQKIKRRGWRRLRRMILPFSVIVVLFLSVVAALTGAGNIPQDTVSVPRYPVRETMPPNRPDVLEDWYIFTALPEDYSISAHEKPSDFNAEQEVYRTWSNGEYTITFRQSCSTVIHRWGPDYNLLKTVDIHGYDGRLYEYNSGSVTAYMLIWSTDRYKMNLQVAADSPWVETKLDPEQLVRWAQSLQSAPIYRPEPNDPNDPDAE